MKSQSRIYPELRFYIRMAIAYHPDSCADMIPVYADTSKRSE